MTARLFAGIDTIEISRIEAAVTRWGDRFLQRVYTDSELAYCRGKARRLAGRFAGKEAVSKALGVGIRTLSWRDIEILPDRRGKPHVYIHGRAAEIADRERIVGFDLSITHSRTDATVMVVAWRREE